MHQTWAGRHRAGFTLVELMIVVSVIGILAAIAIPNYRNMAERARRGSCFSNQRNLAVGGTLYCADLGLGDAVIGSGALVDAGYCTPEMSECPSSPTPDFDDYQLEFEGGKLVSITCLIFPAEHALP